MVFAKKTLRLIEWRNINFDLMQKSQTGKQEGVLARLAQDEKIDYFLSHSWHDNGEAKFNQLCEVVKRFRQAHGRDPTFWLDKVCIDQSDIGAGLKVLPINIRAKKVGSTTNSTF